MTTLRPSRTPALRDSSYEITTSPSEPAQQKKPKRPAPVPSIVKLYMQEAEELIAGHEKCPMAWKRNIKAFLVNCLKQVRYVSSWQWAIHAMKEGWCKHAPFQYFKWVLVNPRKYKFVAGNPLWTKWATFFWLEKTKGWQVARSYGKKVGLIKTEGHPVYERNAVKQANLKAVQDITARAGLMLGQEELSGPTMSIKEFEAEREFRKKLVGPAPPAPVDDLQRDAEEFLRALDERRLG